MEDLPEPSPVGDTTTRACLHFATAKALHELAAENDGVAACPRAMVRATRNAPEEGGIDGDVLEIDNPGITLEVYAKCDAELTPNTLSADGFAATGRCMMQRLVCIMPLRQM